MTNHTVITHAPMQGVTLRKATDPQGVTLSKITDALPLTVAPVAPLPYGWMLDTNDLDGLADWFALATRA